MANCCHLNSLLFELFWGGVLGEFWGTVHLNKKKTGVFRLPLLITLRNKLHVFNDCVAEFATFQ